MSGTLLDSSLTVDSLPPDGGSVNNPEVESEGKVEADVPTVLLPLTLLFAHSLVANKSDPTLAKCFAVVAEGPKCGQKHSFVVDDGMLMRRWVAHYAALVNGTGENWSTIHQIVVPVECRQHVLNLAHEHSWYGHLGVTKSYDRVLQHFV